MNNSEIATKKVLIIGGGFGGLAVAEQLRKEKIEVSLIDRHNYHTFQPLLYQVATGALEPDSIAYPLRKAFKKQKNLRFRVAKAEKINAQDQTIQTDIGLMPYDYLVIATGSDSNFFGNAEIQVHAMPLKTVPEALNLRHLILQNLELALQAASQAEKDALMNIIVVGGGPTGLETAGALAELKKDVFPADYPELDFSQMRIHLLEGAPTLIGMMSAGARKKALGFLKKLGVEVNLNAIVTSYDGETLCFKHKEENADGAFIESEKKLISRNVIWSAGVKGLPIAGLAPEVIAAGNKYIVNTFNQVKGHENIFALGDVAAMLTNTTPKGHPGVAPVAMQMGRQVAKNIMRKIHGASMQPFAYYDKGSMAIIARNKAVVDIGKIHFQGFFAWLTWIGVHLLTLTGFRNKWVVLINWIYSYFSHDKGMRIMISKFKKQNTAS